MPEEVVTYIKSQRTCVLAVEMLDGAPHAATVHIAYDPASAKFFFETSRKYRKAESLFGRSISRASVVIGTDESNMRTLQMDGTISLLTDEEKSVYEEVYLEKFPNKKAKKDDPNVVAFSFVQKWWRFTDWTTKNGKKIIGSDITA